VQEGFAVIMNNGNGGDASHCCVGTGKGLVSCHNPGDDACVYSHISNNRLTTVTTPLHSTTLPPSSINLPSTRSRCSSAFLTITTPQPPSPHHHHLTGHKDVPPSTTWYSGGYINAIWGWSADIKSAEKIEVSNNETEIVVIKPAEKTEEIALIAASNNNETTKEVKTHMCVCGMCVQYVSVGIQALAHHLTPPHTTLHYLTPPYTTLHYKGGCGSSAGYYHQLQSIPSRRM
jgi:hypothetical protein